MSLDDPRVNESMVVEASSSNPCNSIRSDFSYSFIHIQYLRFWTDYIQEYQKEMPKKVKSLTNPESTEKTHWDVQYIQLCYKSTSIMQTL